TFGANSQLNLNVTGTIGGTVTIAVGQVPDLLIQGQQPTGFTSDLEKGGEFSTFWGSAGVLVAPGSTNADGSPNTSFVSNSVTNIGGTVIIHAPSTMSGAISMNGNVKISVVTPAIVLSDLNLHPNDPSNNIDTIANFQLQGFLG